MSRILHPHFLCPYEKKGSNVLLFPKDLFHSDMTDHYYYFMEKQYLAAIWTGDVESGKQVLLVTTAVTLLSASQRCLVSFLSSSAYR